jgi:thiopeptide-type bacteriocin biosynthesis protein
VRQSFFEPNGLALIRASVGDSASLSGLPWPEGRASESEAALRSFIAAAWAIDGLAAAVELASPSLAAAVSIMLSGDTLPPDKAARAAMALARYVVRMRGRATPFGRFAGTAPARVRPSADASWQPDGRLFCRADGRWLAALVAKLEACSPLRQRLQLRTNDLIAASGDRLVVTWYPQASPVAGKAPVEISLRRVAPVQAALRLARAPIEFALLATKLADEFAPVAASRVDSLISELMRCGALISNLRPPSTVTDGLGHVLDVLTAVDAANLPDATVPVAALREVHAELRRSRTTGLVGCADRMRTLAESPAHPVAVDLLLGCHVTVPERVAAAAAAAADALVRLNPHPHGAVGWRDYHAQFLAHYGAGAVVAVEDLINPATGLGLPVHYAGPSREPPSPRWADRDERLAALAQQAALDGAVEVILSDADIDRLAGLPADSLRAVPHADITVEVRAASIHAVDAGEFTIVVCGTGRTAVATSGRFIHQLTDGERAEWSAALGALPVGGQGGVPAQLSFPPYRPQTENVTRVPRMLPDVLTVTEHHAEGPGVITLADLAVTADQQRFYLLSLSRRVTVEPVLTCAPAWHAVPPVARLLFELPRFGSTPVSQFDWGHAGRLPFLPRLRLGRAVLSPARWRPRPDDLPSAKADWHEWTVAMSALRQRLKLPDWVSVGSGDCQLRLNLDHPMDLAILRSELDSSSAPAVITESWVPGDHAWCGGRAHEIVIPLAATMPPMPPPKLLSRRGALSVIGPEHGHLPGADVLSARLYGDPALFDLILTKRLPDLLDDWPDLSHWWFLRFRDPRHHLRLRLHIRDYGQAATRVGQWAAGLRHQGLAGDLVLDTYRPEVARFGSGTAMSAAELLFAADSSAASAQLSSAAAVNFQAFTAASLTDLACAVLGGRGSGFQWLSEHPGSGNAEPMDRAARLAAIAMTAAPGTTDPVPAPVRQAWVTRAAAAAAYAKRASDDGKDPVDVLASLLHLHQNRVHGYDPVSEAATYRLARAAALRHIVPQAAAAAGHS